MFDSVADKHAPLRTRRVRNKHSPWLTSQIRKLIIESDLLKKNAIKTGEPDQWKQYKLYRNKVNIAIRGSGGMPPREILKSQVSEMAFPAF